MKGLVYFLRPKGMDGPVKIGCSADPKGRLAKYNAVAPWELELAATIPGDHNLEGRFHVYFKHQYSHHEWFHPCAEITAAIDAIRAGTFDLSVLPERWGRIQERRPNNRVYTPLERRWASLRMRLRWHELRHGPAPKHVQSASSWTYTRETRENACRVVAEYLGLPPPEPAAEAAQP